MRKFHAGRTPSTRRLLDGVLLISHRATPCTRTASRSSSDRSRAATDARGAWTPRRRREFLYLVKGALRAPTSAYSFVENSFAARVVAHVAQNPELRAELNKRVPPVIVEALQSAVRRTPVGRRSTRRWASWTRYDQSVNRRHGPRCK